MNEVSEGTDGVIALNDTEIVRLVKFFDVLIEMDFASKKLQGDKDVRMD